MSSTHLILSVMAKDKAGIVQTLSDAIYSHQGNWLESSLSRLGGQFAGLVSINIPEESLDDFKKTLTEIVAEGISVKVHAQDIIEEQPRKSAKITVEGNDRRGIVEELSSTLAEKNVNVEKLITQFESASMAGYDLFQAEIDVSLPNNFTMEELEAILENISDDLMVNVEPC